MKELLVNLMDSKKKVIIYFSGTESGKPAIKDAIITNVGDDFISASMGEYEAIIPIGNIAFINYKR